MPTSLIAPIVGSVASAGIGALMGGNKKAAPAPSAPGFTGLFGAGGLRSGYNPVTGQVGIATMDGRSEVVQNIADTFGNSAAATGALLPRVAPGISDLRAARLAEIENARTQSIGNLRENLSRRKVLGSSFAQDAITRANAEFDTQKQQAAAESFLQELDLTNQLTQQMFSQQKAQFQTSLDELNLETQVALSLAGKQADLLSRTYSTQGEIYRTDTAAALKSSEGIGKFAGGLGSAIGGAAGKFFGGGGFDLSGSGNAGWAAPFSAGAFV